MKPGPETVPIGYIARRTHRVWPSELKAPAVQEISSVAHHMIHVPGLPRPGNWWHQNRHNALRHFDSEGTAWTALLDEIWLCLERDDSLDPPWRLHLRRLPPQEFDLYAYSLVPVRLVSGAPRPFIFPDLQVDPLPEDYERLGYDVVSWNGWGPFECSPLLCNFAANHEPVNRYCLFDTAEAAFNLACRYSAGNWQEFWPNSGHCRAGAFCVVEVWRKTKPFSEPERCAEKFAWAPDLLCRLASHEMAHGRVYG